MNHDCIAFYQADGKLEIWPIFDCEQYPSGTIGELIFERDNKWAALPLLSENGMALPLSHQEACARIAASGVLPPDCLLEACDHRHLKRDKTTIRNKRRTKAKRSPSTHGLKAFNSQRNADSRGREADSRRHDH